VGPKNMTSSSGCAVTSSALPGDMTHEGQVLSIERACKQICDCTQNAFECVGEIQQQLSDTKQLSITSQFHVSTFCHV